MKKSDGGSERCRNRRSGKHTEDIQPFIRKDVLAFNIEGCCETQNGIDEAKQEQPKKILSRRHRVHQGSILRQPGRASNDAAPVAFPPPGSSRAGFIGIWIDYGNAFIRIALKGAVLPMR